MRYKERRLAREGENLSCKLSGSFRIPAGMTVGFLPAQSPFLLRRAGLRFKIKKAPEKKRREGKERRSGRKRKRGFGREKRVKSGGGSKEEMGRVRNSLLRVFTQPFGKLSA